MSLVASKSTVGGIAHVVEGLYDIVREVVVGADLQPQVLQYKLSEGSAQMNLSN